MLEEAGENLFAILAGNVRATRLHLGLTIEELAERSSLDVLILDDIERGDGWRLTVLGLGRLAHALGVPASELLACMP